MIVEDSDAHVTMMTARNAVDNNAVFLLPLGGLALAELAAVGIISIELAEALSLGLICYNVYNMVGGSGDNDQAKDGSSGTSNDLRSSSGRKDSGGSGNGPSGSDMSKAAAAAMSVKQAAKDAGKRFKVPKPNISGKEGAKDVPDAVKHFKPYVGEPGKETTVRFFKAVFGRKPTKNEWGPTGLANKAKKFYDRSFVDPK